MIRAIAVLTLTVFLAACESSATLTPTQPRTERINPNAIVALDVRTPPSTGAQAAGQRLRDILANMLRDRRIFAQVVAPSAAAHYHLLITMNAARGDGLLGLLSEKTLLVADIRLTNRMSRQPAGAFRVNTEGSGIPWLSDGVDNAVDETAMKIVEALR